MYHLVLLTSLLSYPVIAKTINTDNLIRKTQYGKIRGALLNSAANPSIKYYSFKGVPYAKPPLGAYRFRAPSTHKSWSGIRNATEPVETCVQITEIFNGNEVVGSEDCLYLEIAEPKTTRERENQYGLLPVMVWIHGGNFIFGSGSWTGPDYFMEKPVVIVTLQYRLNVFGFLSTKDRYASGNFGLKDQLFALKWVKANIKPFGGDPNKVTIFGESAGGASVVYHMMSRQSQGYFHKGISESGSPLNRWSFRTNVREMTFRLGKHFGINTTNSKVLVEKLREVDYKKLLVAAYNKSVVGFYTLYYAQPFTPSFEKKSRNAFLTEGSFENLRNGKYAKIPYISGFNTEEDSFGYDYIFSGKTNISIYEEYPELLIPNSMNIKKYSQCAQKTLNRIKKFYFNDTKVTDPSRWTKFMSQDLFLRGIIKTIHLIYQTLPMYVYLISYTGGTPTSHFGGVGHHQELQFLWYPTIDVPISSKEDKLVSKRLVTLWTNFANTSNPTPENDELLQNMTWPRFDSSEPYLVIDSNLTISYRPNEQDSEFWDELFKLCGNPPYSTY